MKDPILEVNNLRVSFRTYNGKVQAVRGIDFKLFEGETLAIVGESGSGKSVTTKAILGILPKNSIIEEGEILYKGDDLTKYKEKDFYKIRGKEISLIFQDPLSALNPIMKIGKQITEALVLREHMTKEQAKKRAIELMEMVGIPRPEERFEQYPFQFSGGMRQRIVIAIALASNARIMICDEPTTALDVTIQAKILDEIKEIKRKQKLSVIFITPDLRDVCRKDRRGGNSQGDLLQPGPPLHLGPAFFHAGSGDKGAAVLHSGNAAQHDLPAQGRCLCRAEPVCYAGGF